MNLHTDIRLLSISNITFAFYRELNPHCVSSIPVEEATEAHCELVQQVPQLLRCHFLCPLSPESSQFQ